MRISRICYAPDDGAGQGGGNPPPAPGGNAPPPAGGNPPPATGGDWVTGISDQPTRDWVTAKGFKDVGALANSALNLEKLTGDLNSIVRLPKDDKPESWAPVYDKLGRPKTADEYKLPLPDGDKGEFAKVASGWFHEVGLNTKQAQSIAAKWNEHISGVSKQQETVQAEAAKVAGEQAATALKQEWGKDFDANMALVDRAADAFGMSKDQLTALRAAMGPADAMKFMHGIGSKLGVEDTFVGREGGGGGFGGMTAGQAQAEIRMLKNDRDFVAQFDSQDPKVRGDARARMSRLHQVAYPGSSVVA